MIVTNDNLIVQLDQVVQHSIGAITQQGGMDETNDNEQRRSVLADKRRRRGEGTGGRRSPISSLTSFSSNELMEVASGALIQTSIQSELVAEEGEEEKTELHPYVYDTFESQEAAPEPVGPPAIGLKTKSWSERTAESHLEVQTPVDPLETAELPAPGNENNRGQTPPPPPPSAPPLVDTQGFRFASKGHVLTCAGGFLVVVLQSSRQPPLLCCQTLDRRREIRLQRYQTNQCPDQWSRKNRQLYLCSQMSWMRSPIFLLVRLKSFETTDELRRVHD